MLAYGTEAAVVLWVASILITAATLLSRKKPKVASLDDALSSSATQGAYIPLVIGRQLVGNVVLWVEDVADQPSAFGEDMGQQFLLEGESNDTGLGKGSGSTPTQPFYRERALHGLAVGPGYELRSIRQNGEIIWEGLLTPDNTPSGTLVTANLEPNSRFRVYWGFPDDPQIPYLATSETHRIPTNYSHAMKVMWDFKDLGQSRQWGRLEYEVVCPCYSQISTSPSQIPRTGDDSLPTTEQYSIQGGASAPSQGPTTPLKAIVVGRAEGQVPANGMFTIPTGTFHQRALIVTDSLYSAGGNTSFTDSALDNFFDAGGIVKIWRDSDITQTGTQLVVPTANAWAFFRVSSVQRRTEPVITHSFDPGGGQPIVVYSLSSWLEIILGPEIDPNDPSIQYANLSAPNIAQLPYPQWANPEKPYYEAIIEPVDTRNTDGVNPVHMIDQLLFAKFPYGAGKDRTKFDAQSIDRAAEILQDEVVRGGIQIADGENVESVMTQIMQDVTLITPYSPETGKYTFRVVRYDNQAEDVDDTMLLEAPTVETIRGDRPVDVIAFTFKDRQRNYREVPVKVADNGQIYENDTQRAQKVPIEVTQDRDSVSRMAPRRSQEALGNLTTVQIQVHHAMFMALPGSRVSLSPLDDVSIRYIISDILRDVNSPKVEIDLLLDAYDPPNESTGQFAQLILDEPPQGSERPIAADALQDFVGIEVPRLLSTNQRYVEMFFAGVRGNTSRTLAARIYMSRDDTTFSKLTDKAPLVAMGFLSEDLGAKTAAYDDTGSYGFVADQTNALLASEDLTLYPDQWRAGRQVLLIGDEVIYTRSIDVISASDSTQDVQGTGNIEGLIRGRAGTNQSFHASGTPFYVFLSHKVEPFSSDAFLPGKNLHFKAVPVERSKVGTVDSVNSKQVALTGKALTPIAPSALRMGSFSTGYDTGGIADLNFVWSYHSSEFPRTGLGHQTLGAATGVSDFGGHFIIRILDSEDNELYETTSNSATFAVDTALRASLSLDGLGSWQIGVSHVEGSFTSDETTLTIFPT